MEMENWNIDVRKKLLDYLSGFISDHKKARFAEVIRYRTKYITIVLEDIFQPHNASAVLRTCDCFGIQDVHIIENRNKFTLNPDVTLGSSKWLSLYKYHSKDFNTIDCLSSLKDQGYKIVASTPHKNDCRADELPLDQKIALIFGTEMDGLSKEAISHADAFVKAPMVGFTESFNISVSAAILLYALTEKLRKSEIKWQLNENEITYIQLDWARRVVRSASMLEKKFFSEIL